MSDEFKTGDRVRLKPNGLGWLQPFQRFADEGRPGTLTVTQRAGWRGMEKAMFLEFDVKRKGAKPQRMEVIDRDIERI